MKKEYIQVYDVANKLGMDRSWLLKYLKDGRYGKIKIIKIRDRDKQNQLVCAISIDDFNKIKDYRQCGGFNNDDNIEDGEGVFYVIQINPNHIPFRYKFGFTTDIDNRVRNYITICPNLKIVKKFQCRKEYEIILLRMVQTHGDGNRIGQELFDIKNIDLIINKIGEVLDLIN